MKALPHSLLGLALISGGILIGRGLSSSSDAATKPQETSTTRAARSTSSERGEITVSKGKHDLEEMRKRFRAWSDNGGNLNQELGRLSVAALKDLLTEQMALSGKGSQKERQARQSVISAALLELYRREGVAAYEWVDALENKKIRQDAMRTLMMGTVRDHPDVVLPWIRKYKEENNRAMAEMNTLNMLAFAGAAERGADEVIRIHELFGEKIRWSPFGNTKFADNFDFAKLQTALAGKIDMADVFTHWAAREKDAAWRGVKEDIEARGEPAGRYFGSVVLGAVAANGEKAGVEWAALRLAEMSPEQRKHCLPSLDNMGKLTVEGVSAFVAALPPEDRKEFAKGLLNGSRSEEKVFASLDVLSRSDILEILEANGKQNASIFESPSSFGNGIRKLYQDVESRYSLTPEEIQQIRPKTPATPAAGK